MVDKKLIEIAACIRIAKLTCQKPEEKRGIVVAAHEIAKALCTGQSKNHFLMLCEINPFEVP